MKAMGIFNEVAQEVGEIIVADVNLSRIAGLVHPDRDQLITVITRTD